MGSFKNEHKDERRSVASRAASSCQKRIRLFRIKVAAQCLRALALVAATAADRRHLIGYTGGDGYGQRAEVSE
jgi:hypothetical protein